MNSLTALLPGGVAVHDYSVDDRTLLCSKTTNMGKLAGAIAQRIRAGGDLAVDAVGPMQTHLALDVVYQISLY